MDDVTRLSGEAVSGTEVDVTTLASTSGPGRHNTATSRDLTPSGSSWRRFDPGTIFANRFRIVAPPGKGGMGEVYRADDLKLGQTVALKLLPEHLANHPGRLAQFHHEVRIARTISRIATFCRTYDIGDADPSTGSGQAWPYAGASLVIMVSIAAVAAYGFYASRGDEPPFGRAILDGDGA
jgi:hypothetical protein